MTPIEQELDILDNIYVADSPYDTQLNVAKRIKELQDIMFKQETINEQLSEKEGFFYDKPE